MAHVGGGEGSHAHAASDDELEGLDDAVLQAQADAALLEDDPWADPA